MIKNRLEYWRAQYCALVGRVVDQKEFGELLGMGRSQYNRYENHKVEPSIDSYESILKILQSLFPEKKINIEDLYQRAPE